MLGFSHGDFAVPRQHNGDSMSLTLEVVHSKLWRVRERAALTAPQIRQQRYSVLNNAPMHAPFSSAGRQQRNFSESTDSLQIARSESLLCA
jgi:hypothetical protein